MDEGKIRAILPYFGGKRTLAEDIVAEMGPHSQWFEPFCGSLAVTLAKPVSQKETVNDLHGDVTNLARVLQVQTHAEALYERLQRVLMCEGLLDDARQILESSSVDVSEQPGEVTTEMQVRAFWFFIASWMGRNGTVGTERLDYQIAVRWTKNGGSPTRRFQNAVDSIPWWHQRLRNVVVLRRDAFDISGRFEDDPGTLIYADPPYPAETRSNGDVKAGGGGRYLHEFKHDACMFGGEDDHARLAGILRGYKRARIIVSSYDCERYRRLYEGWTFVDKTMNKNLYAQNGRGQRAKEAPEILIINGPRISAE